MTDKELRKLSRLELLELLLEATKENEKLQEKIDKLKEENETARNIENLSAATYQVENALRYASGLIGALKNGTDIPTISKVKTPVYNNDPSQPQSLSDREIYLRMLCFFAKNDEKLSVFPADIENDVRTRIKSILKKANDK